MAMATALRELHRVHRQLSDLRERLDRGPKQIRARQSHVAHVEEELAKAHEEMKNAKMTCDRKNLELKTGESKIQDLQVKLNAANSNKEYQALKDQIAAAEMAGSVLSDEILEELEEIDQLQIKIGQSQQRVADAKQELVKVEQKVAGEADNIKADIARLERELVEVEQGLPAEFKPEYVRLVRGRGEDALAVVEDGCCTGCYQSLRPNQQVELQMGQTVFCSCGRILYLPEGQVRGER